MPSHGPTLHHVREQSHISVLRPADEAADALLRSLPSKNILEQVLVHAVLEVLFLQPQQGLEFLNGRVTGQSIVFGSDGGHLLVREQPQAVGTE